MGLLGGVRPLNRFHMAEILGFCSAWIRAFSKHKQGFIFYFPSLPVFLKASKILRMHWLFHKANTTKHLLKNLS